MKYTYRGRLVYNYLYYLYSGKKYYNKIFCLKLL